MLLEMLDLLPGESVIDIACGSGLLTFPAMRSIGGSGRMVATDISEGMLNQAGAIAAAKGIANLEFGRMDAETLEFGTGTFDAAMCGLGLMYVADPLAALREMHRVLREGGRAAVAVWGARSRCGWAEVFPIVDRQVQSEVCPMFFQMGTGDALAYAMGVAGFSDVRAERISVDLHYETAEDACAAVFVGGPVALAYRKFTDSVREKVHAEYLESIEPFRLNGTYEIPGEYVIVCGRKPSAD